MKALKGRARKDKNGIPDIVYSFQKFLPFYIGKHEYAELGTSREYKLWAGSKGMTTEQMGF